MVAVVGDGGGYGAGNLETESVNKAVGDATGSPVSLYEGNLADVLRWVSRDESVDNGQATLAE